MSILSVFIDESGDFGEVNQASPYYLVTLVLHEQNIDISKQVHTLEETVKRAGFSTEYIHSGPIIRREDVFKNLSINERRQLLYKMLNFVNACPILQTTIAVDRKKAPDRIALSGKLSRAITNIIEQHWDYFHKFDKLIIYYDNGQHDLGVVLNAVFSAHFSTIEFRKAAPQQYRLLQAADFICIMELLRIKRQENNLSRSEKMFFYKPRELKKTFLKIVDRKRL